MMTHGENGNVSFQNYKVFVFLLCSNSVAMPSVSSFRPYVELVNILLSCGEEVKEAITHSVRSQCEQNWGALCESLTLCSPMPNAPAPGAPGGPPDRRPGTGAGTATLPVHSDLDNPKTSRQDKDKPSKGGFNLYPRSRGQGSRRANLEAGGIKQEDPETTDIRR